CRSCGTANWLSPTPYVLHPTPCFCSRTCGEGGYVSIRRTRRRKERKVKSSTRFCSRGFGASILLACVFVSPVANGATYYVASTGSDSNPGSQSLPFRQIRRGVSAASPGDTILVADGSYLGRSEERRVGKECRVQ